MAESYSTSLKLTIIGAGDLAGTWGNTTNTNLGTLLEQAITGVQAINLSGYSVASPYVLTSINGALNDSRNAVLIFNGATQAVNVTCPGGSANKVYIVVNQCSFGVTLTASGGSTQVTIPAGMATLCYLDGTNQSGSGIGVYPALTGTPGSFTVNGNLTATGVTDTGNLSIGGTLGVTGATTLSSGLTVSGGSVLTGDVVASTATGNLYVGGSSGTYAIYNKSGYLALNGGAPYQIVKADSGTYGINISGNAATATTASTATTATTANSLNSSNNYTVQNLNALNGVQINGGGLNVNSGNSNLYTDVVASINSGNLYVGGSSGTYAVINRSGQLSRNGGGASTIVTSDGGTYSININGNANSATYATNPSSGGSFVTSSNIGSYFPASFNGTGYVVLPNNIYIQWGETVINGGGTVVNYATAMPNVTVCVVMTPLNDFNNSNSTVVKDFSKYGFSAGSNNYGSLYNFWIAIGF